MCRLDDYGCCVPQILLRRDDGPAQAVGRGAPESAEGGGDAPAKQPVELRCVLGREIVAVPPEPVAALRDEEVRASRRDRLRRDLSVLLGVRDGLAGLA